MELLENAISLNPIDPSHQVAMAKLMVKSKDFAGALQRYRNVLFLHPSEEKSKQGMKELIETHNLPQPKG